MNRERQGEEEKERGRKYFSCKASQLKFPLEAPISTQRRLESPILYAFFFLLKKSIQPSGRLSHLQAGGSVDRKLHAWTRFTALPGEERRGCHRVFQQKQSSIYLQVF